MSCISNEKTPKGNNKDSLTCLIVSELRCSYDSLILVGLSGRPVCVGLFKRRELQFMVYLENISDN